ncbi:DUF309 domain-containing protein [Streptosporangium saharense]|uniref:DUF309 domain-containing protein n=1 Tax=Streptosporangium saharense TaxID=1706840 RepID=A0A7W7QGD7_9ACTN|nr:DUF309 domain-containing protein [Streptosporangium saharense]MBB4913090.1 hypothetical protein [Streptosporangium saharense]
MTDHPFPRDRDPEGRPRNRRPRDAFGRPLPHGEQGVDRIPDDYAPTAEEALTEARRLLGEGKPFHAHEVLEGRWKNSPEEERELWQGLAQICVGLTHLQRGNPRGATTLLTRGATRITPYGPHYESLAQAAHSLATTPPPPPQTAITTIRDLL